MPRWNAPLRSHDEPVRRRPLDPRRDRTDVFCRIYDVLPPVGRAKREDIAEWRRLESTDGRKVTAVSKSR